METPVIREEVQAYLRASLALVEFSRYTKLTPAEIEVIGNLAQGLGLNHPTHAPSNRLI